MKKITTRKHADLLKRSFMKSGFDSHIIQSLNNKKAAMFDIVAEREQLARSQRQNTQGMSRN